MLGNMKIKKHSALIILYVMISLTTAKAMNIVQEEDWNSPSREIIENPANNFLDGPLLSIFKEDSPDGRTIGDISDQLPEFADDVTGTTIKYSVIESEIPVENPNDPTNDTISIVSNAADYELADDSAKNFEDNPTVIYIHSQARAFSMEVREFHECVSCNADNGARKYYNECLQKLSLKNKEIIQSCCNVSFDSDFCKQASAGKINYKTICEAPEKALAVGDCFWQKIEDKDTEDIKLYRECKKQILVRYCTTKSYMTQDTKNGQVSSNID